MSNGIKGRYTLDQLIDELLRIKYSTPINVMGPLMVEIGDLSGAEFLIHGISALGGTVRPPCISITLVDERDGNA
jgi:hypothetical protein